MAYDKFERLGVSPMPRPFPGKYPTRMQIKAIRGDIPFQYTGKPVSVLKMLVRKQFICCGGNCFNLRVTEFDQNGIIRRSNGGNLELSCTFADLYHPVPQALWENLGRATRLLMMLDRVLVKIDGISVYTNKFWLNTPWLEGIHRMARNAIHARLGRQWFTEANALELSRLLEDGENNPTQTWTRLVPVVPTPPTPTRPVLHRRPRNVPPPEAQIERPQIIPTLPGHWTLEAEIGRPQIIRIPQGHWTLGEHAQAQLQQNQQAAAILQQQNGNVLRDTDDDMIPEYPL